MAAARVRRAWLLSFAQRIFFLETCVCSEDGHLIGRDLLPPAQPAGGFLHSGTWSPLCAWEASAGIPSDLWIERAGCCPQAHGRSGFQEYGSPPSRGNTVLLIRASGARQMSTVGPRFGSHSLLFGQLEVGSAEFPFVSAVASSERRQRSSGV
ncbi:hypothetical protein NDU88_003988 [Pleurodeles waltl]|uniref:Uncharacterized protein n=1 Tax=Pleurodeles waltl TaxID=8319 RepID=A0AAV7RFG0_PLEWA|nr:hypothetical protein NDU88_003988 [Pleurodeles waltl]